MEHFPKDYYYQYMPRVSDITGWVTREDGHNYFYAYCATHVVQQYCCIRVNPLTFRDRTWCAQLVDMYDSFPSYITRGLAAPVYSDTTLRVTGAALTVFMPVIEYLTYLGFSTMTIELMDSSFNPIVSKQVALADTLGNRHFVTRNNTPNYHLLLNYYSTSPLPTTYGIYDVMFDTIVSVTGNFYLSAYCEYVSDIFGKSQVAVPFLYLLERQETETSSCLDNFCHK